MTRVKWWGQKSDLKLSQVWSGILRGRRGAATGGEGESAGGDIRTRCLEKLLAIQPGRLFFLCLPPNTHQPNNGLFFEMVGQGRDRSISGEKRQSSSATCRDWSPITLHLYMSPFLSQDSSISIQFQFNSKGFIGNGKHVYISKANEIDNKQS